jgi:orotate phosphoribosyltransferase
VGNVFIKKTNPNVKNLSPANFVIPHANGQKQLNMELMELKLPDIFAKKPDHFIKLENSGKKSKYFFHRLLNSGKKSKYFFHRLLNSGKKVKKIDRKIV